MAKEGHKPLLADVSQGQMLQIASPAARAQLFTKTAAECVRARHCFVTRQRHEALGIL